MNKKTIIKYGSIFLFILITGLCYSCRQKQQPIINLANENENKRQPEEEIITEKLEDIDRIAYETEAGMSDQSVNETIGQDSLEAVKAQERLLFIHVCGAVNNPDVYSVKEHSRVADVIKLAGGLKEDAADYAINQASIVTDGQQIYVPTKEEIPSLEVSKEQNLGTKENSLQSTKVNLNKADLKELMTLPGIGKSKAESILSYREEKGTFLVIEDLMRITGIKEAVFNKIKDLIDIK